MFVHAAFQNHSCLVEWLGVSVLYWRVVRDRNWLGWWKGEKGRFVFHRESISAPRVWNTTTHIKRLNHEVSPNYESLGSGFLPSMPEERQASTGLCPLNGRRSDRLEAGTRVYASHRDWVKEGRGKEFRSFLRGSGAEGDERESNWPNRDDSRHLPHPSSFS